MVCLNLQDKGVPATLRPARSSVAFRRIKSSSGALLVGYLLITTGPIPFPAACAVHPAIALSYFAVIGARVYLPLLVLGYCLHSLSAGAEFLHIAAFLMARYRHERLRRIFCDYILGLVTYVAGMFSGFFRLHPYPVRKLNETRFHHVSLVAAISGIPDPVTLRSAAAFPIPALSTRNGFEIARNTQVWDPDIWQRRKPWPIIVLTR